MVIRVYGSEFWEEAIGVIDEYFGKGYAIKHPEIVAKFANALALEHISSSINQEGQRISKEINDLTIELTRLQFAPEGVSDIALALSEIAENIKKKME
jgi:hypothetical protein